MIYYDLEEVLLKVDKMFSYDKYVQARRLLEEVLEEEPGYGPAHFKLGWMYWARLDDYEKAERHFGLAIKFSPEYPPTYYSYSLLLNEVNDFERLRWLVEKGMKVKGVNKFFMHNELGKSFEMNGKLVMALEEYEAALKFAMIVPDGQQVKSNIHRVKEKMFEASLKNSYQSEARS